MLGNKRINLSSLETSSDSNAIESNLEQVGNPSFKTVMMPRITKIIKQNL